MWRHRSDYKRVVEKAFERYLTHRGVSCAFCGRVDKTIAPAHLFSVGAFPSLKKDVDNVVPLCYKCHTSYDHASVERRRFLVERYLPGRWEMLARKIRNR